MHRLRTPFKIIPLALIVFVWAFLFSCEVIADNSSGGKGWYWYFGQKVKDEPDASDDDAYTVSSYTRDNEIDVTIQDFREPEIIDVDDEYQAVEMEGLDSIGEKGEAPLPVKGVKVLVPAGKRIKNSYLVTGEKETLPGSYKLKPTPRPVPLTEITPGQTGAASGKAQTQGAGHEKRPHPAARRRLIAVNMMRGYKIAVFTLHPVQYSPENGEISFYRDMSLKVELEDDDTALDERGLRTGTYEGAGLKRLIANTQDITSYSGSMAPLGSGATSMPSSSGVYLSLSDGGSGPALGAEYVVITSEHLKNTPAPYNFQALCVEKESRGITTALVTTEWIYANYQGRDRAERIRSYIRDSYNHGTDYVLLGGDATGNTAGVEIVPTRYFYDAPWPGSEYTTANLPSDVYYSSLEGTMDANGNGIFGEPSDNADLMPEVLVGRAPVSTYIEVSNFVKKSLAYRESYSDYLKTTYQIGEYLGYGGVTEFAKDSLEEIRLGSYAHGLATEGFASRSHLRLNTLYDKDYWPTPSGIYTEWAPAELISIINEGAHIINHLGHGQIKYGLSLYPSDIYKLQNEDPFFCYSQACLQGAFDADCIVEHFVKKANGAFGFIANSRYGWALEGSTAGPSQLYARKFWDGVFGEGIKTLGGALQDAKDDNFMYMGYDCMRWCYLELNLFGDPELMLKTDPQDMIPPSSPPPSGLPAEDPPSSEPPADPGTTPDPDAGTEPGGNKTESINTEPSSSEPPDAEFVTFPADGEAPLTVRFANLSSGDFDTSKWDFGDGIISNLKHTKHVYNSPGVYSVTLTVTGDGGTDIERKEDCISVTAPQPDPPDGGGGDPAGGSSSDWVEPKVEDPGHDPDIGFDSGSDAGGASAPSATSDPDEGAGGAQTDGQDGGGGVSSGPDYGSGTVSPDTGGAGSSAQSGFPSSQADGQTGISQTGQTAQSASSYIVPVSDFSFTIIKEDVPCEVRFEDKSSGDITSWYWTFGDGGTSAKRNPTYTYNYEGIYSVRLKVTGPAGEDIEEKVDCINAARYEAPTADFVSSTPSGTVPLTVYFADQSQGDITNWRWDFGDGTISTLKNTKHIYANPGTYTVSLEVSGPAGIDIMTRTGHVAVSQPAVSSPPARTSKDIITITSDFPRPTVREVPNRKYIVEMEDADLIGNPGEPLLPVKGVNVLIPPGKIVNSKEVICGEKVVLAGEYDVNHAQVPAPLSISSGFEYTGRNKEIYDSDDIFPQEKKRLIADQDLCGYEITTFTLHPVEYKPKSGELSYYKSMTLKIYLDDKPAALSGDSQDTGGMVTLAGSPRPLVRNNLRDRERVAGFVDNPEDISAYDALSVSPGRFRTLAEDGGHSMRTLGLCSPADNGGRGYEYVVITNERLKNAPGPYNFQGLIQEKIDRGVTATIVTTEDIYAVYDGNKPSGGEDDATKIRNFIRDAYDNWNTAYVLLGGDATGHPHRDYEDEIIPVRFLFSSVDDGSAAEDDDRVFYSDGEPTGPPTMSISIHLSLFDDSYADPLGGYKADIPSDLYYACLGGSMDADKDGIYGEAIEDEVDLLAEVYVGRAPVVTEEELSNFVRKNLEYRRGQSHILETLQAGEYLGFGGVSDYAKDSLEEVRLGSTAHQYETKGFAEFEHLVLDTLYDKDFAEKYKEAGGCGSCEDSQWPKEDLIEIINNGVHIINHLGHANEYTDMKMGIEDVDGLTNNEYYFGYSQGCLPGSFEKDCVIEHMVKNRTGAFAFVANSRYGWGQGNSTAGPSQYFARQFWDAVFGEFKWKLGEANQSSKEDNLWTIDYSCHRWCYYELNLFGDPETTLKFDLSDGFVNLKRNIYNTSAEVEIFLIDSDLEDRDTVTILLASQTEPEGEMIVLNKKYSDIGIFEGTVRLDESTEPIAGDGKIQVDVIDEITAFYNEEDPSELETDTAEIDGIPPKITSEIKYKVTGLSIREGGCAEVEWTTDEPTNPCVYYGKFSTPDSRSCGTGYTTDQYVSFCELPGNTAIKFYVKSTDRAGNEVIDDNNGQYYQFIIKAPLYEATPREFTFDVPEGSTDILTGEIEITNTTDDEEAWPLEYLYYLYPSEHIELSRIHTPHFSIPKEYQLDSSTVYRGRSESVTFSVNPKELEAGTHDLNFNIRTNSSDGDFAVQVTVNALPAPAVHFSNYYIIDDKSKDSRCSNANGDGRFNAGETIALNFEVENKGSLEAVGGYAHIELLKEETIYDPNEDACPICGFLDCDGGCDEDGDGELDEGEEYNWQGYELQRVPAEKNYITIIRDSVNLGSIPAKDIRKAFTNFVLSASEDAKVGVIATFAIDIRGNGNTYHWREEIELSIDVDRYTLPSLSAEQFVGGKVFGVDQVGAQLATTMKQIDGEWVGISYFVWMDDRWKGEETEDGLTIGSWSADDELDVQFQMAWVDVFDEDKDQNTEELIFGDVICLYDGHDAVDVWLESDGSDVYVMYMTEGEKILEEMYHKITHEIYFVNSRDYGETWSSATSLADSERVWRPAMENYGENIYVAWEDRRNSSWHKCTGDLYVNTSSDGGDTWSGDSMLVSGDGSGISFPNMEIAGDHIYVAWVDDRRSPDSGDNGNDIYFKHCKFGQSWSDDILVTHYKPADETISHPSLDLSADGNGNVYISWTDRRNSEPITMEIDGQPVVFSGPYDLYVAISTDHGNTWRVEEKVGADPEAQGSVHQDSIETDSDGNLYVTWTEARNGVICIFISKYDVETQTWTHDIRETDIQVDEGAEHDPVGNMIIGPMQPIPVVSDRMGLLAVLWIDSSRKETNGDLFINFNSRMVDTTGVINFDVVDQIGDKLEGIVGEYIVNPMQYENMPGAVEYKVELWEEKQEGVILETRFLLDLLGGMHAPASYGPCANLQNFAYYISYGVSPQLVIDADGDGKPDRDEDSIMITDESPNEISIRAGARPKTFEKLVWFPGKLGAELYNTRESMGLFGSGKEENYELKIADISTEKSKNLHRLTFKINPLLEWLPAHYNFDLLLKNEYGKAQKSINVKLEVLPPETAVANFTSPKTEVEPNEEVEFINTTKYINLPLDKVTKYLWDFGDGQTFEASTHSAEVRHPYTDEGSYEVSLTVKWDKTDGGTGTSTETKKDFVKVTFQTGYGAAGFTAEETDVYAGDTVTFTNTSTGFKINKYIWDFGDGTDTVEQPAGTASVSHPYDAVGAHTVTLTLEHASGSDDEVKTDYINVRERPVADFTTEPAYDVSTHRLTVEVNEEITFTNASTGEADNYIWYFGDNSISTNKSPVTHEYAKPDVYALVFRLLREGSRIPLDTKAIIIEVKEKSGSGGIGIASADPAPDTSTDPAPQEETECYADFSYRIPIWTFEDGTKGPEIDDMGRYQVHFGNDSFCDESVGAFTQYIWNFGNGEPLRRQDADSSSAESYYAPGNTYTVRLVALGEDPDGGRIIEVCDKDIKISERGEIEFAPLPQLSFTMSDSTVFLMTKKDEDGNEIKVSPPIKFTNTTSGARDVMANVDHYEWAVQGGNMLKENEEEAIYEFPWAGTYNVVLTVYGKSGHSGDKKRIMKQFHVLEGDIDIAVAFRLSGRGKTRVNFEGHTSIPVPDDAVWKWDFKSRLGYQYGRTATYLYTQRAETITYEVILTVTDKDGNLIGDAKEYVTIYGLQSGYGNTGYGNTGYGIQ